MDKTVIIDGIRFTLSKGKNYHYNSKIRKHLHQYIWETENGKTPEGYEIHHIDLNPLNNDLSNLQIMTIKDHKALHSVVSWNEERRQWARENLRKNALPKAIEWQSSEKGREWHKKHYQNIKDKFHQRIDIICEHCGKEKNVGATKENRFCSNACKSAWRRKAGVDNIVRVCVCCGGNFEVNKYSKTESCSKSCMMKRRHQLNKLKDSPNLQE